MGRRQAIAQAIKRKAYKYHMLVHVFLGLLCAYIVMHTFPNANGWRIIWIAILGSVIPDVDHLLFMFIYGRKSEYAKIIRAFVKNKEFRKALSFMKDNHKTNTGLYSHNILALIISIYLAWYLGDSRDRAGFYVFFMSWSVQYVFDMFEDLIFLRRFNPNWFMRFNRVPKKADPKE